MLATQGLEYIITLTDQITGPLKGVMKSIDDIGNKGKDAMMKIGAGVAGIVGAGAALYGALSPAIEFSRALSEVQAAGIGASGLKKVQDFALEFSSTFGLASTDVVNSVNEIARAIEGLTDDELIAFSKGSNVLAKATGSSVKEMGSYLSTMYGIFKQQADAMGKAEWVEMMAGQATLTANMFKSSGESLSQAFTNLMSTGQDAGISLAEQYAVLGNLQSVMPGGMSGTKYAAFINGVVKAQDKLGLSFLDANNKMRSMPEILTEIKKRYGDLDAREMAELSKAFGTKEAVQVVSYLLPKIDELKGNIAEISQVGGLDDAIRVSNITTDSWMRLQAILTNIRIAIGGQVLKAIAPLMQKVADLGKAFVDWLNTYKNIARWIGYISGAIIGAGGLAAALTLLSGIVLAIKVVAIAFGALLVPVLLFSAKIGVVLFLIYQLRDQFKAFASGFIQGFKQTAMSMDLLFAAFDLIWRSLQRIWQIFVRIGAAIFDSSESLSAFSDIGQVLGAVFGFAFNTAIEIIQLLAIAIDGVATIFEGVAADIISAWNNVTQAWADQGPIAGFIELGKSIGNIFKNAFRNIVNMFVGMLNFIIEKANTLPGINIPLIPKWESEPVMPAIQPQLQSVQPAMIGVSPMQQLTSGQLPVNPVAQPQLPALSPVITEAHRVSATNVINNATLLNNAVLGFDAVNPKPKMDAPNLTLSEKVKPQFIEMPKNEVKNLSTTNNNNNSINIHHMTVQSNDPREWQQRLRDQQQLAAG